MIERLSKEVKETYNSAVKEYKERVEQTLKKAKKMEMESRNDNSVAAKYKKAAAASIFLKTVTLYCEMNDTSLQILKMKNDSFLTDARKNTFTALSLLESIVGNSIDSSLTENYEILIQLPLLTPKRLHHLLRKIEYAVALVEYEEGDSSKVKWTLVELYGKYTVMCKNLINFRDYAPRIYNPMDPFYSEINELFRMVKNAADTAAKKYREKYELLSQDVADINKAIEFMELLVKIHILLNESNFAQEAKKTKEKWKEKLEIDLKKKDEEKKSKPAPTKRR